MTKKKPVMLVIMDGFGCSSIAKDNAVAQADLKVLPKLWKEYPHSYLGASGEDVGLPDGQIGNSEVGHLNIGVGRIVYQALTKITKDIKDGAFFKKPARRCHGKRQGKRLGPPPAGPGIAWRRPQQ